MYTLINKMYKTAVYQFRVIMHMAYTCAVLRLMRRFTSLLLPHKPYVIHTVNGM